VAALAQPEAENPPGPSNQVAIEHSHRQAAETGRSGCGGCSARTRSDTAAVLKVFMIEPRHEHSGPLLPLPAARAATFITTCSPSAVAVTSAAGGPPPGAASGPPPPLSLPLDTFCRRHGRSRQGQAPDSRLRPPGAGQPSSAPHNGRPGRGDREQAGRDTVGMACRPHRHLHSDLTFGCYRKLGLSGHSYLSHLSCAPSSRSLLPAFTLLAPQAFVGLAEGSPRAWRSRTCLRRRRPGLSSGLAGRGGVRTGGRRVSV